MHSSSALIMNNQKENKQPDIFADLYSWITGTKETKDIKYVLNWNMFWLATWQAFMKIINFVSGT